MYTVYCMLHTICYVYFYCVKFPLLYLLFSCRGLSSVKTPDVVELEEKTTTAFWNAISNIKVNIHVPHPVPKELLSEQKMSPNIPNRIGAPSFVDITCFITKTSLSILRTQKQILHKGICIRHNASLVSRNSSATKKQRFFWGVAVLL